MEEAVWRIMKRDEATQWQALLITVQQWKICFAITEMIRVSKLHNTN
jgi:hypothetical protein